MNGTVFTSGIFLVLIVSFSLIDFELIQAVIACIDESLVLNSIFGSTKGGAKGQHSHLRFYNAKVKI